MQAREGASENQCKQERVHGTSEREMRNLQVKGWNERSATNRESGARSKQRDASESASESGQCKREGCKVLAR
jgi:hypothetical protein